jgi:hypothetical protein
MGKSCRKDDFERNYEERSKMKDRSVSFSNGGSRYCDGLIIDEKDGKN